jgi:heme/copper-type cytochrome/quinol oxidase subunit 3
MNDNFFKFNDKDKTEPKIQNSKVIMVTLFIVVLFILSVIFLSSYFKDMIIISKVFFIFLSISLCVFIIFIGYLFFTQYSANSQKPPDVTAIPVASPGIVSVASPLSSLLSSSRGV